jgi:fatty-acid desaturase
MKEVNLKFRFGTFFLISAFHIAALTTLIWTIYIGEYFWMILYLPACWIYHCWGLAVGFHRLLVHRSFTVPKLAEYLLTICGNGALQGGHIPWIATHRLHHKFTDQEGDPHSPVHSFWHSHIGWMIYTDRSRADPVFLKKYAPSLYRDPIHYWLSKFWWAPSVLLAAVLFYFGGFLAVGWGIIVPVGFGLEFTWLVNSYCHRFGRRDHLTNDASTNSILVSAVTFGEGWHNNHHKDPTKAKFGQKWYQFDPAWWSILLMKLFGIAKNIKA